MAQAPAVALLVCPREAEPESADPRPPPCSVALSQALGARGCSCSVVSVRDTAENDSWVAGLACVVTLGAWDYHLPRNQGRFFKTLGMLSESTAVVANPVPVVRWNANKAGYLRRLEELGVAVVPTAWAWGELEPKATEDEKVQTGMATISANGWSEAVLKPSLGAGGFLASRVASASALREALAAAPTDAFPKGDDGPRWMLQMFKEEVVRDGELSLVCIGGRARALVRKRSGEGSFLVQEEHGGTVALEECDAACEAAWQPFADTVLGAAATATGLASAAELAFARIDFVQTATGPQLMELELIEPEIFAALRPETAQELADDLMRRMQGVGRTCEENTSN